MGFLICWIGLGILLIIHWGLRKSLRLGQVIFTGTWFLSLSSIWLFPSMVRNSISLEASILVIATHLAFFIGSTIAHSRNKINFKTIADESKINKQVCVAKNLFWALTPIALVGCILAIKNTGAISALMEGTLVYLRALILNKELTIPFYIRMMSNMIYPAAVLGSVCFVYNKRSIKSWIYILLPTLCGVLFGLASGGRGGIAMTTPIILLALFTSGFNPIHTRRDGFVILAITGLIALFFVGIASTRSEVVESTPDLPDNLVIYYFAGPIPALSQWMKEKEVQPVNFDISEIAPVKELLRPLGSKQERSIDEDVVYVPYRFNVYTHLAEHLKDFGVIGTLFVSGIMGFLIGKVERLRIRPHLLGLRALIYAALAMSIFADMTFFLLGWWVALLVAALIFPLSKHTWARTPWFGV